ncbi:MAG: hypothetical protein HRT83_04690 [Hyphomicrobiaceae bacterium]|nr:hypothetical protein [Hyphomicrobiaceae bacterium]
MNLLNWSHRVEDLGDRKAEFRRIANASECQAVALAMKVLACHSIDVRYQIVPLTENRYQVKGYYKSVIYQECVVSLDPVCLHLNETFDIKFCPEEQLQAVIKSNLGCPYTEDPEPIKFGRLEFGALLYELIASKIPLYPRKVGEELKDVESICRSSSRNHDTAFTKLSALKFRHENK